MEEEMRVSLKYTQVMTGAMVGLMREVKSRQAGLKHIGGSIGDLSKGWGINIEGALGEMAVAQALGLYWSGSVDTFTSEPDVGIYEVRTRSKHEYELLIRPKDKDDTIYIHVTGLAPDFWIRGWMYAREAKRDEWKQTYGDRHPAWFVPNEMLHPMSELPAGTNVP